MARVKRPRVDDGIAKLSPMKGTSGNNTARNKLSMGPKNISDTKSALSFYKNRARNFK